MQAVAVRQEPRRAPKANPSRGPAAAGIEVAVAEIRSINAEFDAASRGRTAGWGSLPGAVRDRLAAIEARRNELMLRVGTMLVGTGGRHDVGDTAIILRGSVELAPGRGVPVVVDPPRASFVPVAHIEAIRSGRRSADGLATQGDARGDYGRLAELFLEAGVKP